MAGERCEPSGTSVIAKRKSSIDTVMAPIVTRRSSRRAYTHAVGSGIALIDFDQLSWLARGKSP
jgi:hypothetical protein